MGLKPLASSVAVWLLQTKQVLMRGLSITSVSPMYFLELYMSSFMFLFLLDDGHG